MYKKISNIKDLIIKEEPEKIFPYYSLANKYLKIYAHGNRTSYGKTQEYVNAVINLLNFWEEEYGINFEEDYALLKFDMFQDYLNSYYLKVDAEGDFPGNEARERKRKFITDFALNLKEGKVCDDLQNHYIYAKRRENGRSVADYELTLQRTKSMVNKYVYRYCPDFFVAECLKQSRLHDIDVFMRVCLQVDAGMRPSESGNVRLQSSSYGPGYTIETTGNKQDILQIKIDLRKEEKIRPLRSDGTSLGGIKVPRTVDVLPANCDHLADALREYIKATSNRARERMQPLVTNKYKSKGINKAQTYKSYLNHFKVIVERYVIPELEKRGGEQEAYAKLLKDSYYGPHFFREYFTCKLVEAGYHWSDIMHYRGDSSPDSAIIYYEKGRAFDPAIKNTNDVVAEEILNYEKVKLNENERNISIPKLL